MEKRLKMSKICGTLGVDDAHNRGTESGNSKKPNMNHLFRKVKENEIQCSTCGAW